MTETLRQTLLLPDLMGSCGLGGRACDNSVLHGWWHLVPIYTADTLRSPNKETGSGNVFMTPARWQLEVPKPSLMVCPKGRGGCRPNSLPSDLGALVYQKPDKSQNPAVPELVN